jgi:hypothetical protein
MYGHSQTTFHTNLIISTWKTLGEDAFPDYFFVLSGHEHPFSHFNHGTTTTTTNIVEGRGANGYAGGIGTFRQFVD